MASITYLTPDSLLELKLPEDGTRYELSDGELVTVGTAGLKHELAKSRIHRALVAWSTQHAGAEVFSDSLFTLGEGTARIPDVAVLLPEKMDLLPDKDVVFPVAPDVAVEVISGSESAADAEHKVQQYLAAGVKEIWQVYPIERLIRVRRTDSMEDIKENDMLSSRVLTGFEAPARRFFFR